MSKATGPKALEGSAQAKRLLALLLEALGGVRSTQEAAAEMGVALVRYYQLETRALQAMLKALEPRPKGRKAKSVVDCQEAFAREKAALTKELQRYKALCRSLQKAVGVVASKGKAAGRDKARKPGKAAKTRRVRRSNRGERVAAAIRGRGAAQASCPVSTREEAKG